jgi:hypothetical protein
MGETTLLTGIALVALGLVASAYGVLVGSGGGFIVSPLLILLFGMDHNQAAGTSLISVFLTSVSGAIPYLRLKRVDLRSAVLFSLAAIPGSILGVWGLEAAPGPVFNIALGVLLGLVGLFVFARPYPSSERALDSPLRGAQKEHRPGGGNAIPGMTTRRVVTAEGRVYQYTFLEPAAVGLNAVFGFVSSFFGIGGGPLRMPALVYLFRFPVHIAVATSIAAQALYTGVGSAAHILNGNVATLAAVLVGVGVIVGAQLGVRFSRLLQGVWILRLLALGLVSLGVRLVLAGLGV